MQIYEWILLFKYANTTTHFAAFAYSPDLHKIGRFALHLINFIFRKAWYTEIMTTFNKTLGDLGEEAAVKYLKGKGYTILDRNFQNAAGRRLGELDIVAQDGTNDELVFVEVKTRELEKYAATPPEENITPAKLRRLEKIAQAYLRQKNLEDLAYRFDAVSVWLDPAKKTARVKHIESL